MKGLKRMFQRRPRWQVEHMTDFESGWKSSGILEFVCPVEAFLYIVEQPRSSSLTSMSFRVWDRRRRLEVLWPGKDYTLPEQYRRKQGESKTKFVPDTWSLKIAEAFVRESHMMRTVALPQPGEKHIIVSPSVAKMLETL